MGLARSAQHRVWYGKKLFQGACLMTLVIDPAGPRSAKRGAWGAVGLCVLCKLADNFHYLAVYLHVASMAIDGFHLAICWLEAHLVSLQIELL